MSEAIFEEDKGEENAKGKEVSEEGGTEEGSTESGSTKEEGSEGSGESEADRGEEGSGSESEGSDRTAEDAETEEAEAGETESEGEQPLRIELPEDSHLDESHVTELVEMAKELGLSQEQAQEWMNDRSAIVSEMLENAQQIVEDNAREELAEASKQWKEELKSDPEIGGDKAAESAELAKRFAEAYLPKELIDWMDETGYGNQIGIVKAFRQAAIDLGIGGDGIETGGNHTPKPKSDSEIFYG